MSPFTVVAHLASPPVLNHPLMLDALLFAGVGAELGAGHPSGWADESEVIAAALPLATVRLPDGGWWYAASQAAPTGRESRDYVNRVPPVDAAARWSTARSLNVATGPDKRLRRPFFYRPGMLRVEWTGVGDRRRVAELLSRVPSVGGHAAHGFGWVQRWEVTEGGPGADEYRTDVRLRHIPEHAVADKPASDGHVTRLALPLRAPYWRRSNTVVCWQEARR